MAVRWAARCTERRHRGTGIVPLAAQGRPGTAGIGFFFGTYINVVTSVSFSQRRREGRLSGSKIRRGDAAAASPWPGPARVRLGPPPDRSGADRRPRIRYRGGVGGSHDRGRIALAGRVLELRHRGTPRPGPPDAPGT